MLAQLSSEGFCNCILLIMLSVQEIDEMLAGSLSQEDEDAVLAELEAITQVGLIPFEQR